MTLTGGQTYFLIFCSTVVAIVVVKTLYTVYRISKVTSGPCKACKELEKKVSNATKIAVLAWNTARKEK